MLAASNVHKSKRLLYPVRCMHCPTIVRLAMVRHSTGLCKPCLEKHYKVKED